MDIIKQYLPLCWLTLNPLDLPRSFGFLKHNVLFYFVAVYFLRANMTDDPAESFFEVTFGTALTLVLIAILLALNNILYAYVQVATALLFVSNVIAASAIPVLVWLTLIGDTLSLFVLGFLIFWLFLLVTYILRCVLMINWPASVVMALFYFATTYLGAYGFGLLFL